MENKPNTIVIKDFTTESGAYFAAIHLSYELFGPELHRAPVVLVNHALTGNSNVIGTKGWWNVLIGENKTIDTNRYTILAFNVPGNGFDGNLIENYLAFTARDIARLFIEGLKIIQVKELYAIIGGSVGGGIAWEIAALAPKLAKHLIPIASDWKATDWLIANCFLQDKILNNSVKPIEDARMHAMMCYRTPESFKARFDRSINQELEVFNVESWLSHHGDKLQQRFQLSSYKLMNQLLKTIDISRGRESFLAVASQIEADIHIIGINSDLFFTIAENKETYQTLKQKKDNVTFHEIDSIHGHDAFLIEYKQLDNLLKGIF